jgi:hypothetical protein
MEVAPNPAFDGWTQPMVQVSERKSVISLQVLSVNVLVSFTWCHIDPYALNGPDGLPVCHGETARAMKPCFDG